MFASVISQNRGSLAKRLDTYKDLNNKYPHLNCGLPRQVKCEQNDRSMQCYIVSGQYRALQIVGLLSNVKPIHLEICTAIGGPRITSIPIDGVHFESWHETFDCPITLPYATRGYYMNVFYGENTDLTKVVCSIEVWEESPRASSSNALIQQFPLLQVYPSICNNIINLKKIDRDSGFIENEVNIDYARHLCTGFILEGLEGCEYSTTINSIDRVVLRMEDMNGIKVEHPLWLRYMIGDNTFASIDDEHRVHPLQIECGYINDPKKQPNMSMFRNIRLFIQCNKDVDIKLWVVMYNLVLNRRDEISSHEAFFASGTIYS